MRAGGRATERATLVALSAISAACGGLVLYQIVELRRAGAAVGTARERLALLGDLRIAYDAAETNQRAYAVTGAVEHRDAQRRAAAELRAFAAAPGSPLSMQQVEAALAHFAGTIALRDRDDAAVAVAQAFSPERRAATRDVHDRLRAANAAADAELLRTQARARRAERVGIAILLLAAGAAAASLALVRWSRGRRADEESDAVAAAYRQLFEQTDLPFVVVDAVTDDWVYFNAAVGRSFGLSTDEFRRLKFRELLARTSSHPQIEALRTEPGVAPPVPIVIRAQDGALRRVISYVVSLRHHGRMLLVAFGQDVTELETQGRALLAAQADAAGVSAELASIYVEAPVGLGFVDAELRFRAVNAELAAINGLPIEAHLGRTLEETLPPELALRIVPLYRRVLDTGEPLRALELHGRTRADPDRERWWLASYVPVEIAGRRVGVNIVVVEITARKEAEARLQELNAELERRVEERTRALSDSNAQLEMYTYSMAHDLRAPLRNVHSLAEFLVEDHGAELSPGAREYVRRIVAAAGRMNVLIHELLVYARVTREALPAVPLPLDGVVRDAIRSLQALCERSGADLVVEPTGATVLAHRETLATAIANLVANACTYVAPGTVPRVRVRGRRAGGRVRLEVADSGLGIDPAQHERIFRAFERLHGQDHYPGTGLGLAIVRAGVERMGGTVGVESEPGTGSVFWLDLPSPEPE